uniref:Uncharacterized protein n=1 Tax=Ixodes ricinus TaxID=34613 RepID=A0A147BUF7_IXORI
MFSTPKRARGLLNVDLFLFFFFLSPFCECLPVLIRCFSVCTLSRVSQSVLCLSVFLFVSSSFFFFRASVILSRHSEKGLTFLCVCCVEQGWLTCRFFFLFVRL